MSHKPGSTAPHAVIHTKQRIEYWIAGGAYSAPTDLLDGEDGAGYSLPKIPTPALGHSDLAASVRAWTFFTNISPVGDGRQLFTTIAESLAAMQYRVQTCAVGSQTHSRPRWRRILDPGNDGSVEYVVQ